MTTATASLDTRSGIDPFETVRAIGPILSQGIEESDNNRRITKKVFNALREGGFHKLFLPKSLGGSETDPITVAKLVEEVARHNTAAGWSMMVANVSAWWCGRFSDKGIEEIYKDGPDTFMAGAVHPPMKATPTKGGFLINGRTPLTSNVHESHWVFVSALVMDQGQPKMNNGMPEIIGLCMRTKDCEIVDTWHTIGMQATDSNDVKADNVFVSNDLTYPLSPEFHPNRHFKGALYRFPAIGAGIASLIAPVALAVARNAIEELKLLAQNKVPFGSAVSIKDRGAVQRKLGVAEANVQSSRAYLFQEMGACWKKTLAGDVTTLEDRARLLLAVTHTNQTCLQAVDLMYSAAGTSGIYLRNKIAHYFTDAQVIRQHGFSNESRYETAAQIYFGLPPDLPFIYF